MNAGAHIASQVVNARRAGTIAKRRAVPPTRAPTLIESDYAGRLVAIVGRVHTAARHAIGSLSGILRHDAAEVRLDATPGKRVRLAMDRVRSEVDQGWNETAFEGIASDFGQRVSAHGAAELARQSRAALGVELAAPDSRVPGMLRGFVHENVTRIRTLQGRTLDDLETILMRAAADGSSVEAVAAEIEHRFGIAERHARLIAQDQIGKLNSRVTAARHQELGMVSYIWQHNWNPNPRHHHIARHGSRFRYDSPPFDGHPGWAICCHCQQLPDFEPLRDLVDAEEPLAIAPPWLVSGRDRGRGRGIGFDPVITEAEAGALELAPNPDWSFAPGMESIVGEPELEGGLRPRGAIPLALPGAPAVPAPDVTEPGPGLLRRIGRGIKRAGAAVGRGIKRALRLDGELVAAGWDTDGRPLIEGIPERSGISAAALYVVPAEQLRDRAVASPQGGDGSGPVTDRRLQRVRDAWAEGEGEQLRAVTLDIMPDGRLLVVDGRHRLLVALEQDRDVLVRFGAARDGAAPDAVALRSVARHDDMGYNPYRNQGKFAPGPRKAKPKSENVTKAAAHVVHTAGKRAAAEKALAGARHAKVTAHVEARARLAEAKAAASIARKEPNSVNVAAAKQATARASEAATLAKQHAATVKGYVAAHAEARAAHIEAKKLLTSARAERQSPALAEVPERPPATPELPAAVPEMPPAVPTAHEVAAKSGEPPPIIWEAKKNPKRVEAAKKAAAASVERRREIYSAVASNLSHELRSSWDKEGHKFMQQEAARIHGIKDRINAASKLSEAFTEQYGSASETGRGYEGDRYYRRGEIEAKHAESWANEQERKYYAAAMRAGPEQQQHHQQEEDDVPF